METLWIVSYLIALSSFSVKVGLGLAATLFDDRLPTVRRWIFFAAISALYILLFLIVYLAAQWITSSTLLRFLIDIAFYGVWIHLGLAFAQFTWGIILLRRSARFAQKTALKINETSKGHWLLVTPCPVCVMVILGAALTGRQLFALPIGEVSLLLGSLFFGLVMATLLATLPFRKKIAAARDAFLSLVMISAAMFMLLMMLVAPVCQEIQKIYAMARQKETSAISLNDFLMLASGLIALFAIGFLIQIRVHGSRFRVHG